MLGTRAPVNTVLLEGTTRAEESADLSAIWTLPEQPGRPQSRLTLCRVDGEGRIMLPLTLTVPSRLTVPAERDGAVLTVFLPGAPTGSPTGPAPARTVAALPLDERGRLTVHGAAGHELGWSAGTEVIVAFDPDRRLLTLCAASAVEDAVLAGIEAARSGHPPATAHPGDNVRYLTGAAPPVDGPPR